MLLIGMLLFCITKLKLLSWNFAPIYNPTTQGKSIFKAFHQVQSILLICTKFRPIGLNFKQHLSKMQTKIIKEDLHL